jgi:branched-chain amino acid transport system ATP-binding protein
MTASAALCVRNLCKRFGTLAVAQSIDLDVSRGARIGLIGPNGAGKTTLINLLTGMLTRDAGTILLNGEPIEHLPPEARVQRGLVRTHQINTLLAENSACDNVAIAIAQRENLTKRLFKFTRQWRACQEEARSRLADIGLHAVLDRRVSELPYGQQRLLEIAIALSLDPRVLLLDEPAAGVPSVELHVIHAAMSRLPQDIAIVIIEHDMDLVFRFAREIVVLVHGAVMTRGSPIEVSADPVVRAVYLGKAAV